MLLHPIDSVVLVVGIDVATNPASNPANTFFIIPATYLTFPLTNPTNNKNIRYFMSASPPLCIHIFLASSLECPYLLGHIPCHPSFCRVPDCTIFRFDVHYPRIYLRNLNINQYLSIPADVLVFNHHFLKHFFHIQPLLSIPLYHIRPQVVKLPLPLFGPDLLWQYHFTISSISSEWISTTLWKSRSLWIVFVSTI